MKPGFSTWTFPWRLRAGATLAELAEFSAAEGAEVFQIADNCNFFMQSEAAQEQCIDLFRSNGMEVELGISELSLSAFDPVLRLCERKGVRLLRVLPHKKGKKMPIEEGSRLLSSLAPRLRGAGVNVAVENHDFYKASELAQMVGAAECEKVGICLDAVNNLGQGEGFSEVVAALGKYALNFHCKDYTIRRKPTGLGFEVSGCACGDGMLDFATAKQLFGDLSWIVELWTDEGETLAATVRTEEERAKKSMAFLKKLGGKL